MVELSRAQRAYGDDALILSAGAGDDVEGVPTLQVPCNLARPWRDAEFLFRARSVVARIKPDIVHCHGAPLGALLLGGRQPTIVSLDYFEFRGSKSRLGRLAYSLALEKFSVVTVVSSFCASAFSGYWQPTRSPRVVPNGVNLVQFRPDEVAGADFRRRHGIPSAALMLLYVGRICEQKGSDVLVDALPSIMAALPETEVVLAGPIGRFGSRAEVGKSLLLQNLLKSGGRYLGPLDESEMRGAYNSCDVFVMPTRRDEMFGMAVLEAQACGKPILCSYLGGLPEVASDASAVFIPPGDARALAEAATVMLTDRAIRNELAEGATHQAARFSWQQIAQHFRRVYESAGAISAPIPQSRSSSAHHGD